jgi:hypothetical protein
MVAIRTKVSLNFMVASGYNHNLEEDLDIYGIYFTHTLEKAIKI